MSYEQAKKAVFKGFWILFGVTLLEVVVSLAGKGHIIPGLEDNTVIYALLALIIIILSLYKAYYIVYEFMHMRYEAKGLAMTVLLPTLLLVWAIIAFFQEGNSWGERRAQIQQKNQESVEDPTPRQEGMLLRDDVAPASF